MLSLKMSQKDKLSKDKYDEFLTRFEAMEQARKLYVDEPVKARNLLEKELTAAELKKYIKKNILDQ